MLKKSENKKELFNLQQLQLNLLIIWKFILTHDYPFYV